MCFNFNTNANEQQRWQPRAKHITLENGFVHRFLQQTFRTKSTEPWARVLFPLSTKAASRGWHERVNLTVKTEESN